MSPNRTAKDFAGAAMQFSQAAERMKTKPGEQNRYELATSLIVYHLRTAAAKAREIAEHMARVEEAQEEVIHEPSIGEQWQMGIKP